MSLASSLLRKLLRVSRPLALGGLLLGLAVLILGFAPGTGSTARTQDAVSQLLPAKPESPAVPSGSKPSGSPGDSDELWRDAAATNLDIELSRGDKPRSYRVLKLNQPLLAATLAKAPMQFTADAKEREITVTLPLPDGRLSRFRIVESPILSAELSAKYPGIKTYSGQSLDDPTATARFSWSSKGLQAFVVSNQGSYLVAPINDHDREHYLSYFTHDIDLTPFSCLTGTNTGLQLDELAPVGPNAAISGGSVRTYRLVVSVTPQFISSVGGEIVAGQGTVNAVVNYFNNMQVLYQSEIGLNFSLVRILTPPASELINGNPTIPTQMNTMNGQHQTIVDRDIQDPFYDIGVALGYNPSPGGKADFGAGGDPSGKGATCQSSFKARASVLVPGPSLIHYAAVIILAHEIGHMFGARHTLTPNNGPTCSGVQDALGRVEPGSGSTIMGYPGACREDDLDTGEVNKAANAYFHVHSLLKMAEHKGTFGCGSLTLTGNLPPVITNPGVAATIPALTPFILSAGAIDPNGDVVSYTWEELDPNKTQFRSYIPSLDGRRIFPSWKYILNNGNVPPLITGGFFNGEKLPTGDPGTLNFQVTVRDHRLDGGGITVRDLPLAVRVISTAGPFKVTQPNTAVTLLGGGATTISWNVANTNLSPISTAAVRILLSIDGGATFGILVDSTPNDGSQVVTLPVVQTNTARIAVEAVGNIYFDISDTNFNIVSLPNLTPVQPAGWSDEIVVSTVVGTTIDSSPLLSTNTLYVDWALLNNGSIPLGSAFGTALFVDGVLAQTFVTSPPVNVGAIANFQDYPIGPLSPGTHTLRIVADSGGVIAEANETDNQFTKAIIVSAPPPATVQFTAGAQSVSETPNQTARVNLVVTRGGSTSGEASINYATSDVTARERSDYSATIGTLRFGPGEASKTITVFIVDDSFGESAETFRVTLSNPVGCILSSPSVATVTILSNETANQPNPVKDASFNSDFFVRQHYADFLNREPDASGLAFWKDQIDSCSNQACREIRRINVSAAFFRSTEFQQTGYLVERLYKTAYGNALGISTFGGTHQLAVPIIRLNEFLPDTQQIASGVVIGAPGAEQLLESNKQAFISQFVQRSRFVTAYPASMTPTQFVDKLNTNAGNVLSSSERIQLIIDLTSGAKTRAQVVRAVAEDSDLFNAEMNRAFVLVQYFGYMRRNPNDSPDSNYTGYDFWLTKLNQFDGNFVNAEMVKGFIVSGEYQGRFGP